MDHPFENLNHERFQELCQSLLVRDGEGVRCFPVGQPDGGRDALTGPRHDHTVFQVKFKKKDEADVDIVEWLNGVIAGEKEKVIELAKRGAKKYVLMTNVRGSAHLDVGTIDKVEKILEENLPIPSTCFWRDDLNRLLENEWDLKWVYPELLTSFDLVRALIEGRLSEHAERRSNTIRSYLTDRYHEDEQVKFKQVDLDNRLLELFVDLPIGLRGTIASTKKQINALESLFDQTLCKISSPDGDRPIHVYSTESLKRSRTFSFEAFGLQQSAPGAATFLLNKDAQERFSAVLLEGAPGQGKSTITQYVCQVHRMRLLNMDLSVIPYQHANSPIRIPFRIDLREFGSWLLGKDPYAENIVPSDKKTLEGFIAHQISVFSGGDEFSTSDLAAVCKLTPVVVALDGLDEVADIGLRKDVIQQIIKGLRRLKSNSMSLQSIITSRPAAFSNSVSLSETDFPPLHIKELSRDLIDTYTEKWIRAKHLSSKDAAVVKTTLRDKLDEPHIRELARNPMQLAILLNLVHLRGASLPDRRTALYEFYFDLFLTRESEKSEIVKAHRDTLLELHGFLAWLLHSQAEENGGDGTIQSDQLIRVVSAYLISAQQNPNIAIDLFAGITERVLALVSRVENIFEFEVQPFREYFAARYLYKMAPSASASASTVPGTRPDRFDAIARNLYWFNVSRFFAGFHEKGELSSLVDSLKVLKQEEGFESTGYPLVLAVTLLSDWVFGGYQRYISELTGIILKPTELRLLLASNRNYVGQGVSLSLPKDGGCEQLLALCTTELLELCNRKTFQLDYAGRLIETIISNAGGSNNVYSIWLSLLNSSDKVNKNLLLVGWGLECIQKMSVQELTGLAGKVTDKKEFVSVLLRARNFELLDQNSDLSAIAIQSILDRTVVSTSNRNLGSIYETLSHCLNPIRYEICNGHMDNAPLVDFWNRRVKGLSELKPPNLQVGQESLYNDVSALYRVVSEQAKLPTKIWSTSLKPWQSIVEFARLRFGETWSVFNLALSSTASESLEIPEEELDIALFDQTKDLCTRFAVAKKNGAKSSWWQKQFSFARQNVDFAVFSLLICRFGNKKVIQACIHQLDGAVSKLSDQNWLAICCIIDDMQYPLKVRRLRISDSVAQTEIGHRTRWLLNRILIRQNHFSFSDYDGTDEFIIEQQFNQAFFEFVQETPSAARIEKLIEVMRLAYKRSGKGDDRGMYYPRQGFSVIPLRIPVKVAPFSGQNGPAVSEHFMGESERSDAGIFSSYPF